jgi:hypothetical protein
VLITFPFPRDVGAAAPGDYVNADISVDLGPVLCAVFAGKTPAQLSAALGPVEAELVTLLSGKSCPALSSASTATGQSDLAQLLTGLGGPQ